MEYRNNYVLRKLRYALNLRERNIKEIFKLDNSDVDENTITQYLEREGTPMFRELSDDKLESFLNGLITLRRGEKRDNPHKSSEPSKKGKVLLPEDSMKKGFN